MSAEQKSSLDHVSQLAGNLSKRRGYVYAHLDDAPLILSFEKQLAERQAVADILRQIEAVIDFEFACVVRGVDPRGTNQCLP